MFKSKIMKAIERLREEFKKLQTNEWKSSAAYNSMRVFALDTKAVTFKEVEQMEYEVKNNLKTK